MVYRLLDKILGFHQSYNHPVADLLQPGVTREYIDSFLAANSFGFVLPDEIYELLMWRNGTGDQETDLKASWFVPWVYLMSLQESFTYYNWMKENLSEDDGAFNPSLFLLCHDGGGGFYCVSCSEDSDIRSSVVLILSDDMPRTIYRNLEEMLNITVSCFVQKAYIISEEGDFVIDDEAVNAIKEASNVLDQN